MLERERDRDREVGIRIWHGERQRGRESKGGSAVVDLMAFNLCVEFLGLEVAWTSNEWGCDVIRFVIFDRRIIFVKH